LTTSRARGTLGLIMSAEHYAKSASWQRPVAVVLLIIAAALAMTLAVVTHQA
jgi:hypothetical protein